jgi:hypothetical protein
VLVTKDQVGYDPGDHQEEGVDAAEAIKHGDIASNLIGAFHRGEIAFGTYILGSLED